MDSRHNSRPNPRGRPYRSLRGRNEFEQAYRTGKRRRSGAITLIVAPDDRGTPRVGFVAGRRVGSAVARNRAKRRLREAASRCPLEPDTVYVLVAESGVLTADFEDLVDWIRACSGHANAPKEKR